MKVLFVASNPTDAATLLVEREVTELQQLFASAPGEPVSFVFLPGLHAESLPGEIMMHKPDVLHISAHGDAEKLSMMNRAGTPVQLDARALRAFLPTENPPRLIYLNACDSHSIADQLIAHVPMAIGSTAPITNRAARAGAATFYERLLSGSSVQSAFNVSQNMIEMLQDRQASSALRARIGVDPASEIMHRVPRLIADFVDGDPKPTYKEYSVRFGLVGCPANTTQVVFFTDDGDLIDQDAELENDLCVVVRRQSKQGTLWLPPEECWEVEKDFRLFAAGVTGSGTSFSVSSTLCDAIEMRYLLAPERQVPKDIGEAIIKLRQGSEADLNYAPARVRRLAAASEPAAKRKGSPANRRRRPG